METAAAPRESSRRLRIHRSAWMAAFAVVLALIVWAAWRSASTGALRDAESIGRQRLLLYASSIDGALDKYRPLPAILARDRDVLDLLRSSADPDLVDTVNRRLEATRDSTRASAVYVLSPEGVTLASSNWNMPDSFVGRSFAYRPYYQQALTTGSGRFFGMGTTSRKPGYYMSGAVRDRERLLGQVVVKVDLQPVEDDWAGAGEIVLVADANQIAFLASRADLRYTMLAPLSAEAQASIARNQQYPPDDLRLLDHAVLRLLAPDAQIIRIDSRAPCEPPHAVARDAQRGLDHLVLHGSRADRRARARYRDQAGRRPPVRRASPAVRSPAEALDASDAGGARCRREGAAGRAQRARGAGPRSNGGSPGRDRRATEGGAGAPGGAERARSRGENGGTRANVGRRRPRAQSTAHGDADVPREHARPSRARGTGAGSQEPRGMALILGIDRFMSEARALTNFIGNGVATVVVSRWERELDHARMSAVLRHESEPRHGARAGAPARAL